jgi:hypothetical protein
LAVARREINHHAKVAWHKESIVRNKWTRAKAERGNQKVQTRHEDRKRVKDLGGGRPRYLRKRDLKKLQLESTGNLDTTFNKTMRLEIAKRIARSTVGMPKIRNWTLWRGRPPPKRKKKTADRTGAGNVEAPAPDTEKQKERKQQR